MRAKYLTPELLSLLMSIPIMMWGVPPPANRCADEKSMCQSLMPQSLHPGHFVRHCEIATVIQSCPTLCNPLDRSLPGSSIHGDSSGKNTGLGCHFFLQGIFLNQGLNLGLLHYRQNLYHLGPQESPRQALTLHKHLMIINELTQQVTVKLS